MDLRLAGKLALVTGSTGGIGLAIAYEAVGFFEETDEAWQRLFEVNIVSGGVRVQ